MRPVPLTALHGGINRLRIKGGARADTLYDLVNAYLTQDGSVNPREGTIRAAALTAGTVGLASVNGVFNVFANSLVGVPAGYQCNILIHPTNPALAPSKIWFAKPFLGFPYVVAQFTDGSIFHYWLQSNGTWAPTTVYKTGNIQLPVTVNGFAFQAVRDIPVNPTWTSQTVTTVNSIVEPTQYNGFMFKAIAVAGANPHTGSVEPTWPIVENGKVQEFGDFSTSATAATGTVASKTPLGTTITDRYGNSNVIAGQTGVASSISTTQPASTIVTVWAKGTLYAPGAVVQPTTAQGAFINAIPNGDFENGNDGNWVLGTNWAYNNVAGKPYQGNWCAAFTVASVTSELVMSTFGTVTPGQSVTTSAYVNPNNNGADCTMKMSLRWYDSADTFISETLGVGQQGGGYRQATVTGIAPANAAHVRAAVQAATGTSANQAFADLVSWNLSTAAPVSNFLFEAVQSVAGTSGATEPAWPSVAGNTVIDNAVTWKAIGTSIITWQALPITKSGVTEPVWPTTVGNTIKDGNMSWVCINRQITDPKCPNTNVVNIEASHVFVGNKDIVSFCAAVDPTDYTSANNAGYLPTGLNALGDNPVKVLGLYRSNLVAMNAGGYQMWQVDPDPANMAKLDAQPVGSIYTRAGQAVANDYLFLTEVGVRNLGTVGATANMQVGGTGQPVDALVKAQLKAAVYDPLSLYYPGQGQYWLFFGPQAFVLTINGQGTKSWSRYIFPDTITDWTLNAGLLYLRTAGNLVWQLDASTLVDDFGGANTGFPGIMQWPYIDLGPLGINKEMIGIDIVGDGQVNIQIGFNEADKTTLNDVAGFSTSLNVTPPYTVAVADTVPGTPIPIPVNAPSVTIILTFAPNQAWSWEATNVYLTDARGGGATG